MLGAALLFLTISTSSLNYEEVSSNHSEVALLSFECKKNTYAKIKKSDILAILKRKSIKLNPYLSLWSYRDTLHAECVNSNQEKIIKQRNKLKKRKNQTRTEMIPRKKLRTRAGTGAVKNNID